MVDQKTPETLLDILQHHLAGGKFTYLSYDHQAAEAEYRQTEWFKDHEAEYIRACNVSIYGALKVSKHDIPKDIRDKYPIIKSGKIRRIEMLNDGRIGRIYIGHKYAVPVYERDLTGIRLI